MPKEFDRLRLAIKQQLKKDSPGLSTEELENKSYAIATSQWKKTHDGKAPSKENIEDEQLDEEGRIVVSENTKFYIGASINNLEE